MTSRADNAGDSYDLPTKAEIASLREWLAHWGDGPNWSDKTGVSVLMDKIMLKRLLDAADHLHAYPGIMDDSHLYEWEKRISADHA